MSTTDILPDDLLSSHRAAQMIQVNPSSINKWIDGGRLPACRTPGGHRRIRAKDLAVFIIEHKMPMPPELTSASQDATQAELSTKNSASPERRIALLDEGLAVIKKHMENIRKYEAAYDELFFRDVNAQCAEEERLGRELTQNEFSAMSRSDTLEASRKVDQAELEAYEEIFSPVVRMIMERGKDGDELARERRKAMSIIKMAFL